MRSMRIFPSTVLAGALICSAALLFGSALQAQRFTPTTRIVDRIDESRLVTL